jgi:iron complex outermembrane receptor protein
MQFQKQRLRLAVAGALVAFPFAAAAQQAQKVEKIEVTGSNIKRVDSEQASPVTIVRREDIEKSGATSISDVIRALPLDNNGSISDSFGIGFAAGSSGVSLRGLTVNSTLVLLNGRRMAPYGLADDGQRSFVDLNSIPLDAVERVEVLKDGASAIYGSDAIAGVVNIILRRDFQGATANVSLGRSGHGDGDEYRASITAGTGSPARDRFNAFVNLEVAGRDAIEQKGRPAYLGTNDLRPFGWQDQRPGNPNTAWGATSPLLNARPVDPVTGGSPGAYVPPGGCAPGTEDDQHFCRWSIVDWTQIQPEVSRANLLGKLTYLFSDAAEMYAEAGYFTTTTKTQSTPAGSSSTWVNVRDLEVVSSANVFLPVGHPDNPFNAQNRGARIRYQFADVGARRNEYETAVTRLIGGVRGALAGWDYDAGLGYVASETERVSLGYIRYSVLREMIANGTYRFGRNAGLNSAETYARLSPRLVNETESSTTFVDARATRELMDLAGGPMSIAVGLDLRKEKLDTPGTPYTFEGDIIGLGYSAFNGERDVTALFAEVVAPVTRTLELNAAFRSDRYSDYGTSTTPKVGIKWTPTRTLALRGTYAEGFRAPSPAENGNSSTAGFATFLDPVRCDVTEDPRDCGSASTVVLTTGNRAIRPETSKSYNAGIVFEPLPSTSMSLDFWRIERRDEILGADPNAILANPAGYPGAQIVRDEPDSEYPGLPGRVLAISAPYQNGPQTTTSGFDVDIAHRFALGDAGRLTANLIATYVRSFRRILPDGTTSEYIGTHGPTSLSSNAGTPRVRGTLRFSWERGPATVSTLANYVSGMRGIESAGGECLNPGNYSDPAACRIASFTTWDLTGSYKVTPKLEMYGAVRNLFDRLPPYDPQTYGAVNYNTTFHLAGAVGRSFSVGARYTW